MSHLGIWFGYGRLPEKPVAQQTPPTYTAHSYGTCRTDERTPVWLRQISITHKQVHSLKILFHSLLKPYTCPTKTRGNSRKRVRFYWFPPSVAILCSWRGRCCGPHPCRERKPRGAVISLRWERQRECGSRTWRTDKSTPWHVER